MKSEILVIGSGVAGLSFALKAAKFAKVTLCSKAQLPETNSAMAQGGIAAAIEGAGTLESHIEDTLKAGAGLCHPDIVRMVVQNGPQRIQDLVDWGVEFDLQEDGKAFALTKEGGHSSNRILHFADQTGMEIHQKLTEQVRRSPNIKILENTFVIDLVTSDQTDLFRPPKRVVGAYLMDQKTREVRAFQTSAIVLATGGAGKVFLYTSNWSGATGDGLAMAYRAGAQIANLEFTQFHPTCLYHEKNRNFLISEALRGEGGELINNAGTPFMKPLHPLGSLAPRDIVARSIDGEMKRTGADCVFLDMTHLSEEKLQKRFPNIFSKCREFGINISETPIPVVPAAHYQCGGVVTDENGQSNVGGLYAIGEIASTGLHGANRLASNSLLECLVFSDSAAQHLEKNLSHVDENLSIPDWPWHDREDSDELIVVTHMWDEIRRLMWNYMGIVRSDLRLERAMHRIEMIQKEIRDYYKNFKTHSDIEELRNIALVAELSIRSALMRKESRGIHFNIDYPPSSSRQARDTLLR